MRPHLRPGPVPKAGASGALQEVPSERRGDLLGAEPGAGPGRSRWTSFERVQVRPGRPGEPRGAGRHRRMSVATVVRYTGLSERTVRTCLDRLEAAAIISVCDPDIVAARIKRADRRPQGWDLNLSLVRDDLDEADVARLERQFPGLGTRLAAARPDDDGQACGVRSLHLVAGDGEAVDNWPV